MFFGFALATVAIVLLDAAVTGRSVLGVLNNEPKGSATVASSDSDTDDTDATGDTSALATGTASGVVAAAQRALANKENYEYSEKRPMPSSLFGTPPIRIDCSGFATLCYKAAGLPNPNGLPTYATGEGFTGTLEVHGKQTITPQAGDLAFYSDPAHVTVVVGDGSCISMGQPGDPSQMPVTYREVTQYRTYVKAPSLAKATLKNGHLTVDN
jgi:cell wall-associated NlpC family hydrolase